jgi:hypothetical protein
MSCLNGEGLSSSGTDPTREWLFLVPRVDPYRGSLSGRTRLKLILSERGEGAHRSQHDGDGIQS